MEIRVPELTESDCTASADPGACDVPSGKPGPGPGLRAPAEASETLCRHLASSPTIGHYRHPDRQNAEPTVTYSLGQAAAISGMPG